MYFCSFKLDDSLLQFQLIVTKPLQILAYKLILLIKIVYVGFKLVDGGITFG